MSTFGSLFALFAGLIHPIATILTGVLFTKAKSIIEILKPNETSRENQFKIDSIVNFCSIIGVFTIISGALSFTQSLLNIPRMLKYLF